MTEPHDPAPHDREPQEPGTAQDPDDTPTASIDPGARDAPPTAWASGPGTPRRRWRSRTAGIVAAAVLAGVVLLGGGFGAGYAVAHAGTPAAAAHHPRSGKQAATHHKRTSPRAPRRTQQQPAPGAPAPGAPTNPATPGAPAAPAVPGVFST